ncbi:MAG: hypothetical protein F4X64_12610 [Chloroflexi bacterium]|nr:hypothetical protein [Chloroflexota bacterium]
MAGIGESKSLRDRSLRYLWRLVRLLLAVAIYALVLWYGVETAQKLDAPRVLSGVAVALIALGIAGSTYRILIDVAREGKGAIMVLAAFLNEKLVEPQRRRLRAEGREAGRAEGREEGRAEARAEVIAEGRARLIEEGIDPDLIFPLKEGRDDSERC